MMRGLSIWSWWRRRAGLVSSFAAVVIVALATVLIFLDQFFPSLDWLDEWIYFGLGHDYWSVPIDNYKGSRLTWLFPLAVVHYLFPPIAGQVLLQWLCLTLGGLSALLLLRRLVHPLLAVVVSVIAVSSWALRAVGGADYHNTIAVPLVATMMLALVWAAESTRLRRWFWAGVIAGLAIHANLLNLFMVPFFFLLIALYWRARGQTMSWAVVGRALGGLLTGIVGVTLVMGSVALASGQAFLFWWIGLKTAITASTAQGAWYVSAFDLTYWSSVRPYLFAPMAAAIGGIVYLVGVVTSGRLPASRQAAFILSFLVLAGLWLALHIIGVLALIPDYFAIQLQYPALIALACLVATADLHPLALGSARDFPDRVRLRGAWLGLIGVVSGATLIVGLIWRYEWLASTPGLSSPTSVYVLIVLTGLAAGLAAWLPGGRARLWSTVPIVSIGVLLVMSAPSSYGSGGFSREWLGACWGSNARANDLISQTRGLLARWDRESGASPIPVVIDQGQLISSFGDAQARLQEASPQAFLATDDPRASHCAESAGLLIPRALYAATSYTHPDLAWIPVDGPAGLGPNLAEQGFTHELLADGRPLVLIASTQRDLDALVDSFRTMSPSGVRVDEVAVREGEWTAFVAALSSPPPG